MAISSMGMGSGLDIRGIIDQLLAAESSSATFRFTQQEAKIQSKLSAIGSVKGALSTFQASFSGLQNLSSYSSISASSSDTDALTASASTDAATGTYKINVNSLAQEHKIANATGFASSTDVIGEGSLTFRFGTWTNETDPATRSFTANPDETIKTVDIGTDNSSLEGIRDAVNNANIGVSATIVDAGDTDGKYLVFSSDTAGSDHALEVTASTTSGDLSAFDYNETSQSMDRKAEATSASLTVDGISITRASNTISDVIEGVTLNLKGVSASEFSVSVSSSNSPAKEKVEGFITAFNELNNVFKELSSYNTETKQGGVLLSDASIRSLEGQLRRMLVQPIDGANSAYSTLASIGIETQKDGSLELDSSIYNKALDTGVETIARLFADLGTTSDTLIDFVEAGNASAGTYAVEISALAAQAQYTGDAISNLDLSAVDTSFKIQVDGVESGTLNLTQKAYADGDELAAEMQAQINSDSTLQGADLSVAVSYDSANNKLVVTSDSYGSSSEVKFTSAPELDTNIGLTFVGVNGTDVAGKINGQTALGDGQELTGVGAVDGLTLLVRGGGIGDRGTVNVTTGLINQFDNQIKGYISSDGVFAGKEDSYEARIDDINERRIDLEERLQRMEARLLKQFTAMDALVAQLNSTGTFLSQQLANLPGARQAPSKS